MSLNTFLLIDGGLMILGLPLLMILKGKSSHKITHKTQVIDR